MSTVPAYKAPTDWTLKKLVCWFNNPFEPATTAPLILLTVSLVAVILISSPTCKLFNDLFIPTVVWANADKSTELATSTPFSNTLAVNLLKLIGNGGRVVNNLIVVLTI